MISFFIHFIFGKIKHENLKIFVPTIIAVLLLYALYLFNPILDYNFFSRLKAPPKQLANQGWKRRKLFWRIPPTSVIPQLQKTKKTKECQTIWDLLSRHNKNAPTKTSLLNLQRKLKQKQERRKKRLKLKMLRSRRVSRKLHFGALLASGFLTWRRALMLHCMSLLLSHCKLP